MSVVLTGIEFSTDISVPVHIKTLNYSYVPVLHDKDRSIHKHHLLQTMQRKGN
jgi:hypothetical protein